MKECRDILAKKMDQYLKSHKHYDSQGALCPYHGHPEAHGHMDDIIEDVKQAHDMLHAALSLAGRDPHDDYIHPGAGIPAVAPPPHATKV